MTTGRALPPTSAFAGDDGSVPEPLAAALALPDPRRRLTAVVAALPQVRVLVPVVARLDERAEPGEHGIAGEKSAHAAMVTVALPDGRAGMPVFSGLAALQAWRADARPVPVEGRRAALAAGTEADGVLVLDAGSVAVQLPRPAVRAIALGEPWLPAVEQPAVHAAAAAAAAAVPAVRRVSLEPGVSTEIAVVVELLPGLDREQVQAAVGELSARLSRSAVVAEAVDSLTFRLRTG